MACLEPSPPESARRHAAKFASKVTARCKVIWQLIRRYPHVLYVPLVVLALLLGLSVWGVQQGQAEQTDRNRQTATWEVVQGAQDLSLQFDRATLPLDIAEYMIRKEPNLPKFLQLWDNVAESWWLAAPRGTVTRSLTCQGVITRTDDYIPGQAPSGLSSNIGTDLMALKSPYRQLLIASIMKGTAKDLGFIPSDDGQRVVFGLNVRISGVAANETFGAPHDFTACPPGICYNETTRTKVWGSITTALYLNNLLEQSPFIQTMAKKGYSWQLLRPGNALLKEKTNATFSATNANDTLAPAHAIRAPVKAVDQQWELAIWKGDTWDEDLNYLYVIVVIGSVILSALLFAMLLSWAENRALLHSLLPKETIARLRAEAQWQKTQDDIFKAIQLHTPAQGLLSIIHSNLEGEVAPLPQLLAMRDALQRSVDVYRPMASAVQQRMEQMHVDVEVQQALVAQLVGNTERSNSDNITDTVADLALKGGSTVPSELTDKMSKVTVPEEKSTKTGLIQAAGGNTTPTNAVVPVAHTMVVDSKDVTLQPHMLNILQMMQIQTVPAVNGAQPAVLPVEGDHKDETSTQLTNIAQVNPAAPLLTEVRFMSKVEKALPGLDSWAFDAYAFETATHGQPLSLMGYWLLHKTGLITWAKMDTTKLVQFLQQMESGYSKTNPYHNNRHAADVLQSMHVIIHRGGLVPNFVDPSTLLACYMAAIMHDYEHRGRNNDYLINSSDELALTYNDRSPMENHHLAAAFKVLRLPECDCLSGLSKSAKTRLRKTVIELVLATDMKSHFAILGQFDALHSSAAGLSGRTSRVTSGSGGQQDGRGSISRYERMSAGGQNLDLVAPLSDTDRLLSLQLAMKCSDLGHLTAPLNVHLSWVKDLEEEFFRQGDAERNAGLAISPLCDRNKEGVFKSQVGFFDFVAVPLFKAFTSRFTQADTLRKALFKNKQYWETQAPHRVSGGGKK